MEREAADRCVCVVSRSCSSFSSSSVLLLERDGRAH